MLLRFALSKLALKHDPYASGLLDPDQPLADLQAAIPHFQ